MSRVIGENESMNIEITGITIPQRLAIEHMLYLWESYGKMGHSAMVSFMADGDGNFRPDIKINNNSPRACNILSGDKIDFDSIARKLHDGTVKEQDIMVTPLLPKE